MGIKDNLVFNRENFDLICTAYDERGMAMRHSSDIMRSLFMPYINRIAAAAREPGHPNDALTKIQNILDELNKHTSIGEIDD